MGEKSYSRRDVFRLAAGGAAAALLPRPSAAGSAPMRTRPIPASGEPLPVVGLGTWRVFDVDPSGTQSQELGEVVARFRSGGGRLIDTSPMYGRAEAVVGEVAGPGLFLADKVWTEGREAGIAQIAESHRRLRAPVIDLLQVHNLLDLATQWTTLRREKERGGTRYVGVTHYLASAYGEVERALERERPDFLQINYSLAESEAGERLLPLARDLGVAVIANRPFGGGEIFARTRGLALPPWSAELACESWAELALKWVLGHPAVTCAIPATNRLDHLSENLRAGGGPFPDAAGRRRIAAAFRS